MVATGATAESAALAVTAGWLVQLALAVMAEMPDSMRPSMASRTEMDLRALAVQGGARALPVRLPTVPMVRLVEMEHLALTARTEQTEPMVPQVPSEPPGRPEPTEHQVLREPIALQARMERMVRTEL